MVTELQRSKVVDWLIEVFKAFNINSPKALILAISIVDKYLKVIEVTKETLNKHDLLELALASILLASKFEGHKAMKMLPLLREAGHNRVSPDKLIAKE